MGMQWGVQSSFPAVYEELLVPGFFRWFASDLLDRLAPSAGERMLDVACGTGIIPRLAAKRDGALARLTGLDRTPGMLACAREASDGLALEWVEGDALELPFEDGSFDLVTCQQGLQFFSDRERGASEMRRVLGPRGRAAIACWAAIETQPAFGGFREAAVAVDPALGDVALAPFALHDEHELERVLRAGGFEQVEITRVDGMSRFESSTEFVRGFFEGSPMAIALAELSAAQVEQLRGAALERVSEFEHADGFRAPMTTLLALVS